MEVLIWVIIIAACLGVIFMIYAIANPQAIVNVSKFLFVKPVQAILHPSKPKKDQASKLALIEINANRDVARGNKVPANSLFSNDDLWQNFNLLGDVQADNTRIRVTIAKAGSFQTQASITRKMWDETNCSVLFNRSDFTKKIAAFDDINRGEKLMVTLEALNN